MLINAVPRYSYTCLDSIASVPLLIFDKVRAIFNRCITGLMSIAVVNASSWVFKFKLDSKRIHHAVNVLNTFGMKPYVQGDKQFDHVWQFSAAQIHANLISLGCERKETEGTSYLVFPKDHKLLVNLTEKMHISVKEIEGQYAIQIAEPRNKKVIYCPGSGHIFELRRKTIANFVLNCGVDVIVFHYPGVRNYQGVVNEKTLSDSLEKIIVNELKTTAKKDLVLYGHCIGAAILSKTAQNYLDIPVILDRAFSSIASIAKSRLRKVKIGYFTSLTEIIARWAQSYFNFDTHAYIRQVKAKHLVLYSTSDEFVPKECKDPEGLFLKGLNTYDLKISHDPDPSSNPDCTAIFNRFFTSLDN